MAKTIGVDLGTTYSVIAIPEERHGDRFRRVDGVPGYSIVLDDQKRALIPSVVGQIGRTLVVGHAAKSLAGTWPTPIAFAKRDMGLATHYLLDDRELTPEDVSMHVLVHLKRIAEQALGEPVDAAVITIPAHFKDQAITMTRRAAERAGLKVARMLQEPVAAAWTYSVMSAADSVRIMTYDLGGGTFDASIVEKIDGVLSDDSVKGYKGNQHLGGYNFDKALAQWISRALVERGYTFPDDLESVPALLAALMAVAEHVKKALGRKDAYQIDFEKAILSDDENSDIDFAKAPMLDARQRCVTGQLPVTRATFEELIQHDVNLTIGVCRSAMRDRLARDASTEEQKRNIDRLSDVEIDERIRKNIDTIILVGGSSRLPLVQRRIRDQFGKDPQLVEPDLCVALGAAIVARTMPAADGCLILNFVPARTALERVTISGQVVPAEGLASVEGSQVSLKPHGATVPIRGNGSFVFPGQELQPGATTEFTVSVHSPRGLLLKEKKFSVQQSDRGGVLPPKNHIVNPITLLFLEGPHVVADKHALLPLKKTVNAKTVDNSGIIRVPIHQSHVRIGELCMSDVPKTLEIGTSIEVTITVDADFRIQAAARVPKLSREVTATIQIPPPALLNLEGLGTRYRTLKAQADEAKIAADPNDLVRHVTELNDLVALLDTLFEARSSDRSRIQSCLDELEGLVAQIRPWSPDPPRHVLDEKAAEARALIAQVRLRRPEVDAQGHDARLQEISERADNAFDRRDTPMWHLAWRDFVGMCQTLSDLLVVRPAKPLPPDPTHLKFICQRDLKELRRRTEEHDVTMARADLRGTGAPETQEMVQMWIRQHGILTRFRERIEILETELIGLRTDIPDAAARIFAWYSQLEVLDKDIQRERYAPKGIVSGPARTV